MKVREIESLKLTFRIKQTKKGEVKQSFSFSDIKYNEKDEKVDLSTLTNALRYVPDTDSGKIVLWKL